MKSVIKTAFFVSLASYTVFFLADYIRPGFVSTVFSVHVFLIPSVVFGIWFAYVEELSPRRSKIFSFILRGISSLLLFILFWREGGVFGDLRLVLAVCAFATPWVISFLASEKELGQDEDL